MEFSGFEINEEIGGGELRFCRERRTSDGVTAIVKKLLTKTAEELYQSVPSLARDRERCLADLGAGSDIQPLAPVSTTW